MAAWARWHSELEGKVRGSAISAGAEGFYWAVGAVLPATGRHVVRYRLDKIQATNDMFVGVGTEAVCGSTSTAPSGWYGYTPRIADWLLRSWPMNEVEGIRSRMRLSTWQGLVPKRVAADDVFTLTAPFVR